MTQSYQESIGISRVSLNLHTFLTTIFLKCSHYLFNLIWNTQRTGWLLINFEVLMDRRKFIRFIGFAGLVDAAFNFFTERAYAGTWKRLSTNKVVSLQEIKTAPTISAGTLTLNCATGNVFAVALNANITTLSFTNVPASGNAYGLTLAFTADGTARTITWGGAVKWPGGTAPTLTSTNGKVDVFVLTTWDGGTTWYGFTAGQNA